jgi:hypothetical protein
VPVLRLHGVERLRFAGWRYVQLARQHAHGLHCAWLCAAVYRGQPSASAYAAQEVDGRGARGDYAARAAWKESCMRVWVWALARRYAWLLALIAVWGVVVLLVERVERCY